jgi:hypothetical protein
MDLCSARDRLQSLTATIDVQNIDLSDDRAAFELKIASQDR